MEAFTIGWIWTMRLIGNRTKLLWILITCMGISLLGDFSQAEASPPESSSFCRRTARYANQLWTSFAKNIEVIDPQGKKVPFAEWRRTKTGRSFALFGLASILFYSRVIHPGISEVTQTQSFSQSEAIIVRFIDEKTVEVRIAVDTAGPSSEAIQPFIIDLSEQLSR